MHTNTKIQVLLVAILFLGNMAAAQPDITWNQPANWSTPLVPSNDIQSGGGVWLGPVLDGNQATTYWNIAWMNAGNTSTGLSFDSKIFIDGEYSGQSLESVEVAPGSQVEDRNQGPMTVRGGRHTIAVHHDSEGDVTESNETNNNWGYQFVWTPYDLGGMPPVTRNQPPDLTGGWEDMPISAPQFNNCDGFRFSSILSWSVVGAYSVDPTADYDLYLYDEPATWDLAFSTNLAGSISGSGSIEALIVNRDQVGNNNYNVGVERYSGDGDFKIMCSPSNTYLFSNQTQGGTVDANVFFELFVFDVDPMETGWKLLDVNATPASGLQMAVFSPQFSIGALVDAQGYATTDGIGNLRLAYDFAAPGKYAIMVFCNPWEQIDSQNFEITVREETTDLEPHANSGWHSPLVPRPQDDSGNYSVPIPSSLNGGENSSTYLNLSTMNTGFSAAPPMNPSSNVYYDGLAPFTGTRFDSELPPNIHAIGINFGPFSLPGGRHTLTVDWDPYDVLIEIDETNNIWGEQYVWSPPLLTYGTTLSDVTESAWDGGWETITSGEIAYGNCLGYRIDRAADVYWRAVAISHDPGHDTDLELFQVTTNPKNGFDIPVASSWAGGDYVDYILVNDNVPTSSELDIGVSLLDPSAAGDFELDHARSVIIASPTLAPLGPYELSPHKLIHIYDMYFEAGVYNFRLNNVAGEVDWGMQLHSHDMAYQSRLDYVTNGLSFDNGPGRSEFMLVDLAQSGWYGLTVYKSKVEDAEESGTYQIYIGQGISQVEDTQLPDLTAIKSIAPNPFNPKTTVNYTLDQSSPVRLEIFNLQGTLIRTLVEEILPAGQHAATWHGIDQNGRRVPSGVYLARIRANGQDFAKKMVLVK